MLLFTNPFHLGVCWGSALFALLVPAHFSPCADQLGLTFDQAWTVLQEEHGSLRAAEFERKRLERLKAAARGLLLPQINLEARYTHLNDPLRIDLDPVLGLLPGLPGGVPPLEITIQDQEFWKANISAVWPLYTGGRISAARSATILELEAADEQSRRTRQELHSNLVQRYFAVPLAEEVYASLQTARDGADQHMQHAIRLEEEGLISHAEKLHAKVALTEADRAAKHAARQLEMARTALALFLNLEALPEAVTPLPEPWLEFPIDSAQLRNHARQQHPILGALEANRRLAAEGTRAERGRLHPEVFAFGLRELVTSDLTLLEPKWAVGIGVNFAILDRNDRVNRMRAAQLRERQIESLTEQVARDIETLIESLFLEVKQAAEQFHALDSMRELARENLRVRERAFTEGLATSLQVVDARINLAKVETARVAASYQFIVQYALLRESTGSLDDFNNIFFR